MKKSKAVPPPLNPRDAQRRLQRIFDGWYNDADYYAFLDLLEAVLDTSVTAGRLISPAEFFGGLGDDGKKLRRTVTAVHTREKLGTAVALVFENANTPLNEHSDPEILGPAFCALKSSKHLGQFFTPYHLSKMIAMMTAGDIEGQVRERALTAIAASNGLNPVFNDTVSTKDIFVRHARQFGPKFEPICFMEPCMGAGSMLLAFASMCPLWAIQIGAVQITGIDLDPRAVQMTRINCMLYGIRATLYCGNALSNEQLQMVPPPYASIYSAVRMAMDAGDLRAAADAAEKGLGYKPSFTQTEIDFDQDDLAAG